MQKPLGNSPSNTLYSALSYTVLLCLRSKTQLKNDSCVTIKEFSHQQPPLGGNFLGCQMAYYIQPPGNDLDSRQSVKGQCWVASNCLLSFRQPLFLLLPFKLKTLHRLSGRKENHISRVCFEEIKKHIVQTEECTLQKKKMLSN